MALQISIPNNYGTNTTYWKIVDLNINWLTKSSHVTLCGWVDKDARLDGKQPTDQRTYDWSGDDFPFDIAVLDEEDVNGLKIAYEKIKSLNNSTPNIEPGVPDTITPGEFNEAIDC